LEEEANGGGKGKIKNKAIKKLESDEKELKKS